MYYIDTWTSLMLTSKRTLTLCLNIRVLGHIIIIVLLFLESV